MRVSSSLDLRQIARRLGLIRRAFALVWDSAGRWTVALFALLIVQGLLPAAVLPISKWIVDAITVALDQGASPDTVRPVIFFGVLLAGIFLFQRILSSLNSWISTAQSELVQDHVRQLIHEKASSIDYGFYEHGEYYDMLMRADSQASSRILSLLQNVGMLLSNGVTLLSIGVLLLAYTFWLPAMLVLSTLPALAVVMRHNRIYHNWWRRTTPLHRWTNYYNGLLTQRSSAAEVRMLQTSGVFGSRYQELRKQLRKERLDLVRRQLTASFSAALLGLAILGGAMVWMLRRALSGVGTLGDLALFYQAFNQGQMLMQTLMSSTGQIYTNTLFLKDLFEFLDQENMLHDPATPVAVPAEVQEAIVFENVTFSYPGTNQPALENFSLRIPAGKVVAIVGENGAGKSTLSKLLCRFYDPDEGRVLWDGKDLRTFTQSDLRRAISIMFQMPVQYQATVAENIAIGQGSVTPGQVREAAQGAGIEERIQRLPQGYDTMLGRLFAEGTDLSGGEWQRIALARAFLQQSPLLILDEPTSFMDSWAEQAWLERFRLLVKGRTAVVITHRFSAAVQADLIFVMRRGHVVEAGTHEELLRMSGFYAASWEAQNKDETGATVVDS